MTQSIKTFPGKTAVLIGVALVGLSAVLSPLPALAQDAAPAQPAAAAPVAPSPDTVVAKVGDDTITEADLAFAAEDLGQELANIPPQDRRAFLTTVLIDMKVMAKAAKDQGLDQSDLFKRRLAYLEERALRRAYFAEKISTSVTPEAIKASYDEMVAKFVPEDQVRARHILVATEEEAKAVKAELDAGGVFEDIAKAKSMDPGAANGGDLGFFQRGQMVKPFEDAAFGLEVGKVSDPVQSQFGWHVIKVEEKTKSAPPTLEQATPQLQQQLLFKNFDEVVAQLKAAITVEIPDAALADAIKKQAENPQ